MIKWLRERKLRKLKIESARVAARAGALERQMKYSPFKSDGDNWVKSVEYLAEIDAKIRDLTEETKEK